MSENKNDEIIEYLLESTVDMPDPVGLKLLSEFLPDLFKLSAKTLYVYHARGLMPESFNIGREVYFHKDDIIQWLKSRVKMPQYTVETTDNVESSWNESTGEELFE